MYCIYVISQYHTPIDSCSLEKNKTMTHKQSYVIHHFIALPTSASCIFSSNIRLTFLHFRTSDNYPYPLEPICKAIGQDIYECWYYHPLVIILQMALLVFVLLEAFEVIGSKPTTYFTKLENYLQLSIAILTLTFIYSAPVDMELANHSGAWAVFLTWLNLTQLLARFEFYGLGIFMALHVAKKIVATMLVFTTSFIAFILGFNMLFQANPAFHGIIGTGVKIFVMMQGEFDFDDNLGYQNVHEHGGRNISIQVRKYWRTFKG